MKSNQTSIVSAARVSSRVWAIMVRLSSEKFTSGSSGNWARASMGLRKAGDRL
jgi:hypothetical protein